MSANMELVTSHQGAAHITVDQVKDLIAGMSGDISGIKIFKNLNDALAYEVTGIEQVTVKTGQGLAGGYHFQLVDAYEWDLDPGTVGYSRIDMLYLVIYEDTITRVQTVDLVYEVGLDYPNGTTGTVPAAPTGTNIKETFAFLRADVTDGAIVTVTSSAADYLSNDVLEQETVDALDGFRFGIDEQGRYGYYEVGADTVTPFRNPQGDALAQDVLQGKTFSNASNENIAGIMTNNGAINAYTAGSGKVTIPKGYHDGNGWVSGENSYNSGVAAAQSQTWTRQFSIDMIEFTEGGETKYLRFRDLFYDCRNLIRVKFTRPIPIGFPPIDSSHVYWYNDGGTILRMDVMFDNNTYQTEHTLEPPSGAKYFMAHFHWRLLESKTQTMALTYQTKLLR